MLVLLFCKVYKTQARYNTIIICIIYKLLHVEMLHKNILKSTRGLNNISHESGFLKQLPIKQLQCIQTRVYHNRRERESILYCCANALRIIKPVYPCELQYTIQATLQLSECWPISGQARTAQLLHWWVSQFV